MRALVTALILIPLIPLSAQAACRGETLLSCTINGGKALEVCLNGDTLTYAYGPPGRPELRLSEPLSNGTYTPWNGIGRAIWESIAFQNDGYIYEVYASFDRLVENTVQEHGVSIFKGDSLVTSLACDPGAVAAPFDGLYDVMQRQGYCWNRDSFVWGTVCPD
jgi:hypothetical protein